MSRVILYSHKLSYKLLRIRFSSSTLGKENPVIAIHLVLYTLYWSDAFFLSFALFFPLFLPLSIISFLVAQVLSVPELVILSYSEFSSRLLTKQLPSQSRKDKRGRALISFMDSFRVEDDMREPVRFTMLVWRGCSSRNCVHLLHRYYTHRLHVYLSRAFRWLPCQSWQLQPRTDFDCCLFDQNATRVAVRAVNFEGWMVSPFLLRKIKWLCRKYYYHKNITN